MKRMLRWIRRLVVGILALAFIGITVILIVLHTSWGRNLLRSRIETAIARAFPGSTIERLTGSVLGEVTLHGVHIVAGDGKPLADVETITVDLALAPLVGGTARITRAEASGVVVHARRIPPPVDDGRPPTTWSVELEDARVRGATVILDEQNTTLTDVDMVGSASIEGAGPIVTLVHLAAMHDGRAIAGSIGARIDRIGKQLVDARGFAWFGSAGAFALATDLALVGQRAAVIARVPAVDVARFAPPGSVAGDALVLAQLAGDRVTASATVGASEVDAVAIVSATSVRGVAGVSDRRAQGGGRAVVAGVVEGEHIRATVIAGGEATGYAAGHAIVALDGTLDAADALVIARGSGDARAGLVGHVTRRGDVVLVDRAVLGAATSDIAIAVDGRAPVRGAVVVEAKASGPVTSLAIDGRVTGSRLRYEKLSAAALASTFRVEVGETVGYRAHADVRGFANAGKPVGAVVADVQSRRDGKLDVRARVKLAAAPITANAVAVVTLGDVIDVALGAHRIESRAGTWSGTGGRVRVTKRAIEVRDVKTGQGDAWAKVDATIGRDGGPLTANVEAKSLPVAAIDPAYAGTASGTLSATRTRGRWNGTGELAASGLVLSPRMRPLDGAVTLSLAGRRASVAVTASNAELGGARIALGVDGPADMTDIDAWTRVSRDDLHAVTIGVDHVDLATATGGKIEGVVDGTIEIADGQPSGALFVRGVPTPAGRVDADITVALKEPGFVDVDANATVGELGGGTAGARIVFPEHPFDPRAWRALGPAIVHAASAEAKDIAIDARLLALLGAPAAPYRGTASAKLELGAGASSATVIADIRGISGGSIVRGIDVHAEATADAQGTRAAVQASSDGVVLVALPDAAMPVTLDRWKTDTRAALVAPLTGTITIGEVDAPRGLAILGRGDVTSGSIAGSIALGGTIARPTATGSIDVADLRVAARYASKAPPALTKLRIEGGWNGEAGNLLVTGDEEGGGTLRVEARGRPADLASVFVKAVVKKLDLAPIAPFLPGVLGGAGGVLAADLTLDGAAPATAKLRGTLALTDGRVPLSPSIGTLRRATAKLTLDESGVTGTLDGKLGAGAVKARATTSGKETTVDATLTKVSPIGALQPIIDSTLHAVLQREGTTWTGTATVSKTTVTVPEQAGHALLDAAAPVDLIFVDLPIPQLPPAAAAPTDPWLVVTVDIQPVSITVPELPAEAMAGGRVTVSVGDTLGLDGELLVERGSTDLFGHRYRVELGQIVFDGTTDGLLDLKLAHDFPDVTTFVRFSGRVSELSGKEPELTSDPGLYSKGQLLGFFLGGEPGGDPTKQTREAATGFGAALASGSIGKRLKKYLPISLDVLRCDPGAGTSGASCTFGTWLTHEVFLAYKQKLEARYDENTGDASVEWHFKPSWVLEVSGGDRNYYGGDVLWRRRW